MARPRKTKKEKLQTGTLRKSREAQRNGPADPASDLADAKEMLEVMKENLRQANTELREHGLMILTQIADSHGKFTEVRRVNPALRVQAAAVKAINTLKKQIVVLEEEAAEKKKQEKHDAEFAEFREFA